MGILDVINGMQNGPRGAPQPGNRSGGMSPITMAILGVLAYKAVKHLGATSAAAPSGGTTASGAPGSGGPSSLLGGDLSGDTVSTGLGNLVRDLQSSGQGQVAQSWIGNGPNRPITPSGLEAVLGGDTIDALSRQTGMDRAALLDGISQYLPDVVDHLTPNGRLPSADEAARMS